MPMYEAWCKHCKTIFIPGNSKKRPRHYECGKKGKSIGYWSYIVQDGVEKEATPTSENTAS